ncbi:MAG TPA: lipopolysaccharide biosynthesis protein [Gemmatimonadales bacterium]|nr:lipopolysaccharide biosynthesis protein [Gemmatimonadales bacterium]
MTPLDPAPASSAASVREPAPPGPPPGHLKRRALDGFLWLSLGNGLRAVLKVAVLAVLARLLTPVDFGLVAAAGVVVWFSMLFSSLGVGPALVQRQDLEPRHVATGLTASALFGLLLGLVLVAAAPLLAVLFRMPGLTPVLRGMAVVFPIAGLSLVGEALLQRELRFGTLAMAELVSYAVGYGVVGIGAALAGAGVWALVAAEVGKALIKTVLYLVLPAGRVRPRFEVAAFRDLVVFGSGYTANGLSIYFAMQGDSFVVGRYLGAGPLGLYGRAYELMLVPSQVLGMMLEKILFPMLASVQDDAARLRLAYRRGTALVALIVLPLSALTVVLAPEIVRVLLGPGWRGAVPVLRVLAAAMYLRVGYMLGHTVVNATGAVVQTAWRSALHAVLVVVGALVGQRWGLTGVAAGVVAAITVNFVLVLQLGRRVTGLGWGALAAAHRHALLLALLVGAEAWAIARVLTPLAASAAPAALTLVAAAAAALVTTLLLVRLLPARALGDDGRWLVHTLLTSAPAPLRPLLRRLRTPDWT